jgi:hypothetical protein
MMTNIAERSGITSGGVALLAGILLISVLGLAGCAEPGVVAIQPTATVFAPPPTDIPAPPPGPTPAALDFPLASPTREELAETVSDQNCIDCHSDEETLKAVAEQAEETGESLSEGEG